MTGSRHKDLKEALAGLSWNEKAPVLKIIREREKRDHALRLAELRAAAPPPIYDRCLVFVIVCMVLVVLVETAVLAWVLVEYVRQAS